MTEPPSRDDDEPATAAEILALTRDDVFTFLQASEVKGAELCPICTHYLWGAVMPSENGTINLIVNDDEAIIGSGVLRCIGLVCERCGYVRMHSLDRIARLKRLA